MPEKLKAFVQRWAISTVAVLVTAVILDDHIQYKSWVDLLVATLLLGLLNTFLRPLLMLLSLPLLIVTLGLFTVVINALLLLLVSGLMGHDRFHVDGFGWALLAAVIISVISILLNSLTGTGYTRVTVRRGAAPPPPKPKADDDKNGPVIDV
jgi:putative membrane protein